MPSKKHNAKLPTNLNIQAKSPREALFLQFAQAYYQEMQAVGQNAPFGQALNQADHFASQNTRELGRKSLELVMQDQINNVEKKENESRTCEKCQTKKRHRGYSPKIILSSQGDIKLLRFFSSNLLPLSPSRANIPSCDNRFMAFFPVQLLS